jgi:hypothetical protein
MLRARVCVSTAVESHNIGTGVDCRARQVGMRARINQLDAQASQVRRRSCVANSVHDTGVSTKVETLAPKKCYLMVILYYL